MCCFYNMNPPFRNVECVAFLQRESALRNVECVVVFYNMNLPLVIWNEEFRITQNAWGMGFSVRNGFT